MNEIIIDVQKGDIFGTKVYRGFARLCDLARVSKADIFDQKANPKGTQRDLSPKHAKDAYLYANSNETGYWPEVLLCLRNPAAIKYKSIGNSNLLGRIHIDLDLIDKSEDIIISRVDGNHRLHYADGKTKNFPAIERTVSFCLAYDLSLDDEIVIFRDINNNQKKMNTSHLDNIKVKLTKTEILKRDNPELYIAKKLETDKTSCFYKKIYDGGKKPVGMIMPLRSLSTGIKYLLSKSNKLKQFKEVDLQYKLIRNYFNASKKWQPDSFKDTNKYLMLRGAGFMALCFLGGEVIDRVLLKKKYSEIDILEILNSGRKWDWSNKGDFTGVSGAAGANNIANQIIREFYDEDDLSLNDIYNQIMDD